MSTDASVKVAKNTFGDDDRFVVVNNSKKKYQAGNYDFILRDTNLVSDEDIVVEVDGDDWLPDSNVLNRVVDYYSDGKTWITYGQFIYTSGNPGLSAPVDIANIRTARFTASHLRTWKVWLWNKIKPADLLVDGQYAECSGDVYFMMPMLEMAGEENSKFTGDINYVYNFENPIGDSKGERLSLTNKFAKLGREKASYTKYEKDYS
jgi:glycosyltransferase involved in cell wall biosynthesis